MLSMIQYFRDNTGVWSLPHTLGASHHMLTRNGAGSVLRDADGFVVLDVPLCKLGDGLTVY